LFIFKIVTTRPTTADPFFPYTPLGQTYEMLMELSKATRPKKGIYGLIGFSRNESSDGLTLITEYKFVTPGGKDALLDDFAIRSASEGMIAVNVARDEYNATVGHTSVVTFEKIETE